MDDKLKSEILSSIELEGAANDSAISIIIANRMSHASRIIDYSSGSPRIRNSNQFKLILSQPSALRALSPLNIRCCLCSKIISYPAWHLVQRFAVNHFHFFVCFSGSSDKVSASCYRR